MLRRPPLLVYLSKQGQWHHLVLTQSTFCLALGSGFAFAVLLLYPPPHRVAHMPSEMLTEAACVSLVSQWPGRFYTQSISTSAVYIDLCFPTEKGRCCSLRPGEFIKFTGKRSQLGACLLGGKPGQAKRQIYLGSVLPREWFRPQRYLQ